MIEYLLDIKYKVIVLLKSQLVTFWHTKTFDDF